MMSEEPQISPLRYAPVEMTSLFGNAKYCSQDELSSVLFGNAKYLMNCAHSGVEGSAVLVRCDQVSKFEGDLTS
jgi:hypothetical protein